jgi:putative transposase
MITEVLAGCYEPGEHGRAPESLYGSLKMWAHLRRQGSKVAGAPWSERIMLNPLQGRTIHRSDAGSQYPSIRLGDVEEAM